MVSEIRKEGRPVVSPNKKNKDYPRISIKGVLYQSLEDGPTNGERGSKEGFMRIIDWSG